jgi:hypothetical protein
MFHLTRQYIRALSYGLIVLLAAGIGPACMVDTDGDDETPAVAIELSLALPGARLHLPENQAADWNTARAGEPRQPVSRIRPAGVDADHFSSLPLVVPLRT